MKSTFGYLWADMIVTLNEALLLEASNWLASADPAMSRVLRSYGPPPLWARAPGFATMLHIILEQQVSLASANAAFRKLQLTLGEIRPETFLELSDEHLKTIGYSRQKTLYSRNLASFIVAQKFDFEHLTHLPDEEVRNYLKQLKGIGDWTADIYLSECLLRPDILPKGDIAMLEAFKVLYGLPKRPDHPYFEAATQHWRPWRSVGSRMLWHFYLCERKRSY